MKKTIQFIALMSCVLFACRKPNENLPVGEIIKVYQKSDNVLSFDSLFKSWSVVPLETNEQSVIGNIDRIALHKGLMYFLDRKTNSVVIFDEQGLFIRRIKRVGNGPGEYIALMDFSIDAEKDQLVLHSHRPYKLFYYDLNGNYIEEILLDDYYRNIATSEDVTIFINQRKALGSMVFLKDDITDTEEDFLPISEREAIFDSYGSAYPYVLKSSSLFIFFPFSPVIYQLNRKEVIEKYQIDFGENNMPEEYFDDGLSGDELFTKAINNNYGFLISNFRETESHIVFSYGSGNMVFYSKRKKHSIVTSFIRNTDGFIHFQNYFGHDGVDNKIIGIYSANLFKMQMERYKSDMEYWSKVPEDVKHLDSKIDLTSNPILVVAELKD